MGEIWHIASDEDEGKTVCGIEDDGLSLSDPENIEDATTKGIICLECLG